MVRDGIALTAWAAWVWTASLGDAPGPFSDDPRADGPRPLCATCDEPLPRGHRVTCGEPCRRERQRQQSRNRR